MGAPLHLAGAARAQDVIDTVEFDERACGMWLARWRAGRAVTLITADPANVPALCPVHNRPLGVDGVNVDGIGIGGLRVRESGPPPLI